MKKRITLACLNAMAVLVSILAYQACYRLPARTIHALEAPGLWLDYCYRHPCYPCVNGYMYRPG